MDELKTKLRRSLLTLPAVIGHEDISRHVFVAELDAVLVAIVAAVVGVPEAPIQRADRSAALRFGRLADRGKRALIVIERIIGVGITEIPILNLPARREERLLRRHDAHSRSWPGQRRAEKTLGHGARRAGDGPSENETGCRRIEAA